jgi:FkbM family methyltransferase
MKALYFRLRLIINTLRDIYELIPLEDFLKIVLWNKTASSQHYLTTLKIRPIGKKPVLARRGTSDFSTLKTTFLQQYHLPHKILSSNPTILDLGCNVGYTTLHFAYQYPSARIIGVEMDYDNFKLAQRNTCNFKNIFLLNKAISISDGFVSYSKNSHEDAYQISPYSTGIVDQEIKVESITMSSILVSLNLKYINYMKMDIEGEEVRVFDEQLSDLSWLNNVEMLNIEVHTNIRDLNLIISVLEDNNFHAWKDYHHWSSIRAVRV